MSELSVKLSEIKSTTDKGPNPMEIQNLKEYTARKLKEMSSSFLQLFMIQRFKNVENIQSALEQGRYEPEISKRALLIFEPKSIIEKMDALIQNTFEVNIVIIIAAGAFMLPSLISFLSFILISLILSVSALDVMPRLDRGEKIIYLNLTYLICVIIFKMTFSLEKQFTDEIKFNKAHEYYTTYGFIIKLSSPFIDENGIKNYKFEARLFESFAFEALYLAILLLSWETYYFKIRDFVEKQVDENNQPKSAINLFIKKYEIDNLTDILTISYQAQKIGVKDGSQDQAQITKDSKSEKQFNINMDKLAQSVCRNFIDCSYIGSYRATFFMLFILFQMYQSLSYNGLFDVPQLFLIIIFLIGLGFTTILRSQIDRLMILFAYYAHFVLYVKIVYQIAVRVDILENLIISNPDAYFTILLQILFGGDLKQNSEQLNEWEETLHLIKYRFCILSCLFFVNMYRTATWTQLREQTEEVIPQGTSTDDWQVKELFLRFQDSGILLSMAERTEIFIAQLVFQTKYGRTKSQSYFANKLFGKIEIKGYELYNAKPQEQLADEKQIELQTPDLKVNLNNLMLQKLGENLKERTKQEKQKRREQEQKKYHEEVKFRERQDVIDAIKVQFQDFYLPSIFLWSVRLILAFQAYLYHSQIGFLHLLFVMISFIINIEYMYYFVQLIIIPIYLFEFTIVYSMKIPVIQDTSFIEIFKHLFLEKMRMPALEQGMYFSTIIILFIFVACKKLSQNQSQADALYDFFWRKVKDRNSSIVWKLLVYALKYIQTLVLLILFLQSSTDLNRLKSLIIMIFFTVYTANEYLYRNTAVLLVIFIGGIICAQYYFSLVYHQFQRDEPMMIKFEWLGFYQEAKKPRWKEGDPIYFRHTPYRFDWYVLLSMEVLTIINKLYVKKDATEKLQSKAYEFLRENHSSSVYFLKRSKNAIATYLIQLVLVIQIYLICQAPFTLFNWIFFILNIINFAFIAKSDNKDGTNNNIVRIAIVIKYFAIVILTLETIFISFIGVQEKKDQNHLDQVFKRNFPVIYEALPFIGFRETIVPGQDIKDKGESFLMQKFYAYITYFLAAIFLQGHFEKQIKIKAELKQFDEKEFTKLFNFKMKIVETQKVQIQENQEVFSEEDQSQYTVSQNSKQIGSQSQVSNVSKYRRSKSNRSSASKSKISQTKTQNKIEDQKEATQNEIQQSENNQVVEKQESAEIFKIRKEYTHFDVLDFYEAIRYSPEFASYRRISYWPLFDVLAQYGHFFTNLIIVIVAIFYNISIFTAFNIVFVCIYYAYAVVKLNKKADENQRISGLLSQTDITMASLISKDYKIQAYQEFLQMRYNIWKIQFTFVMVFCCLGFSTPMLSTLREQWLTYEGRAQQIETLDKVHFWVFILGINKDKQNLMNFYIVFGSLFASLIIEKVSINWLENRNGCNYKRLQKFIELDTRVEMIHKGEEPPAYNVDRYYLNYYRNDFDELRARLVKNDKEIEDERKANKSQGEYKDFVPQKVALRLCSTIQFSINLFGRSPSIGLSSEDDDQTHKMLKIFEAFEKELDQKNMNKSDEKLLSPFINKLKNKFDKQVKDKQQKEIEQWLKNRKKQNNEPIKSFLEIGIDEESFPILRKYKISQLEDILREGMNRKYFISFKKGMSLVLESMILTILLASVLLKANIFSLFYLIFLIFYILSNEKQIILVRMVFYISVFFVAQYVLFLINLTSITSPNPFPEQFKGYPFENKFITDDGFKYQIPVFFQTQFYKNLSWLYLIGGGVNRQQIHNLILDFVNLFLISIYIMSFRNPLIAKSMEKVFWQFPADEDPKEKWARLENDKIIQQVNWLKNPTPITDESSKECSEYAQKQLEYAKSYQKKENLNYILITYVDLKYQKLWSNDFIRQKKLELKEQCVYFRLVKKGSVLFYITSHILTIFIIFLCSILRQTFIALGYVFILINRIKNGAEVLAQRNVILAKDYDEQINSEKQNLKEQDDILKRMNESLSRDVKKSSNLEKSITLRRGLSKAVKIYKEHEADKQKLNQLELQLKEIRIQKQKIEQQLESLTIEEKNDLFAMKENKFKWVMIEVMSKYLLTYSIIDCLLQILIQLPIIPYHPYLRYIGIVKIWKINSEQSFTYQALSVKSKQDSQGSLKQLGTGEQVGFIFDKAAFMVQLLNCTTLSIICLQKAIYESFGYNKFTTAKGGTLDHLLRLAQSKADSMAYTFNNLKIKRIMAIQRRKEVILATVDNVKEKLIQWRRFTRQALLGDPEHYVPPDDYKNKSTAKENQQESSSDSFSEDSDQEIQSERKNKNKKVGFDPLTEDGEQIKEPKFQLHKTGQKQMHISQDHANILHQQFAIEFVKQKLEKLNTLSQLYLYLQRNFVNTIIFKNEEDSLFPALEKHRIGELSTPSELEEIMMKEAIELIKNQYDNYNGSIKMYRLVKQVEKKSEDMHLTEQLRKTLFEHTNLAKKIQLIDMQKTWVFTRPSAMVLRLLETFVFILISNTEYILYGLMIFSMYINAGLISLIYPISVFGYALMEETRPRRFFWEFIKKYTTGLLFIKFIWNLNIIEFLSKTEGFIYWEGLIKLGLYDYPELKDLLVYMLPELLIITFIMFNEIALKLKGLYYQNEQDIETIQEGIQRNIAKGDHVTIEEQRLKKAAMRNYLFFQSKQDQLDQKKLVKQQEEQLKRTKKETYDKTQLDSNRTYQSQVETDYHKIESVTNSLNGYTPDSTSNLTFKQQQEQLQEEQQNLKDLKYISKELYKSSYKFQLDDISLSENLTRQELQFFVKEKMIMKSLETDNLYFIEGRKVRNPNEFMDKIELKEDLQEAIEADAISCCDFQEEFDHKMEIVIQKTMPRITIFEQSEYFSRLFPGITFQKPGYDLYGTTTMFLFILAIYVFLFFDQVSVSPSSLLQGVKESNNVFKADMAIVLLLVILIIIIERYVNRSDTKAVEKHKKSLKNDKKFFKQEDMYEKGFKRSMSLKLVKTMKTSEVDMLDESTQGFLQQQLAGPSESADIDDQLTKVTTQQKTKFFMHWIILIVSHIFIFWYFPISGNLQLYGQPFCDEQDDVKFQYSCKNFKDNNALRIFYTLLVIYFALSALQMRYGFPIQKKASSVLQYHDDPVALLGAQIYNGLPFAVEIRCLLDFTFSKTSLDIFQFWQLFNYHIELYLAKNGNISYTRRIIGETTPLFDKCLFGWLISSVIMLILVGPFFFFSELGGFIAPNPIGGSQIEIAFKLNKTMYESELSQFDNFENDHTIQTDDNSQNVSNQTKQIDDQKNVFSTTYIVYKSQHPFIKQYDQNLFDKSKYKNWTETRFFQPDQIQEVILPQYSESQWEISKGALFQFKKDLLNATSNQNSLVNVELKMKYIFSRELPETAKETQSKTYRALNSSRHYDCLTLKSLRQLALKNCSVDTPDKDLPVKIRWVQAFNPNLILGATDHTYPIIRQGIPLETQKHDVLMEFSCPNRWVIFGSAEPNEEVYDDKILINPKTCNIISGDEKIIQNKQNNDFYWARIKLTILSMMVSASFLASFNVTTFYTTVVLVVGAQLRPALLFGTWRGFVYECTHPDAIIKVIEACYMRRHEEDLIGEEECYRMLQEIIRSPELLKTITGSSLKGSCDPNLDYLDEANRDKMNHLNELERKGFEVNTLKENLLKKKNKHSQEFYDM